MTAPLAAGRPRFSVVVPVFNKAPFLPVVVQSLAAAVRTYGDAELIVVDHCSTDGSSEILTSASPGPEVLVSSARGTIAAARNEGAALASGSHLCFVDADCVVPSDYLERVTEVLGTIPAEAVGCKVTLPPGTPWVTEVWDRIHASAQDGYRPWLCGANLTLGRTLFESVGGFDETLETQEDVELCVRLREAGCRLWESHRLAVTHLDNPESLKGFWRKEAWRARGAFGVRGFWKASRPTLAMYLHVALIGLGLGQLVAAPWSGTIRFLTLLLLWFAVPIGSVVYRSWRNRKVYRPFCAIALYQTYYLARLAALVRRLLTGPRPKRRPSGGLEQK